MEEMREEGAVGEKRGSLKRKKEIGKGIGYVTYLHSPIIGLYYTNSQEGV